METDLIEMMRSEGMRAYPHEACGLIIATGKKSRVISCANISESPRDHFLLDPQDYMKAADVGEVIGVWHTHCEVPPTPSDADLAGCENTGVPWYILSVRKRGDTFDCTAPVLLEPSGFVMPYLGRPYVAGIFDCYSLVCDYYQREYGVTLGRYPYRRIDGRPGYTLFVEKYAEEGFEQLIDHAPQPGDIFMMQTLGDVPNHVAVYLGEGVFMHHAHSRLSRRDVYGGFWQKHTTHHLRRRGALTCLPK